jgi:hypothetical protein
MAITSRMVGEFLRECAALVVIFVPLALWKEPRGLNSDLLGDLANAWREQRP